MNFQLYCTSLADLFSLLHERTVSAVRPPQADQTLKLGKVRFQRWFQRMDATHALNRCAGVSYPSVFRGRSFSCLATALSFA